MQPSSSTARRSSSLHWIGFVAWIALFLGARLVLDRDLDLPRSVKLTAALAPVLPTAWVLWFVIRGVRSLDELHRRVHLEALVFAFPLAILLLMTLGLLQLAIDLPQEDWSYRHVWIYLPIFYFAGLMLAWRRYR